MSDFEPNDADLDIIQVGCWCGNTFDVPWDVSAFGMLHGMHCGTCGCEGTIEVIADPSPNKEEIHERIGKLQKDS